MNEANWATQVLHQLITKPPVELIGVVELAQSRPATGQVSTALWQEILPSHRRAVLPFCLVAPPNWAGKPTAARMVALLIIPAIIGLSRAANKTPPTGSNCRRPNCFPSPISWSLYSARKAARSVPVSPKATL
jgi:hypothetical protein